MTQTPLSVLLPLGSLTVLLSDRAEVEIDEAIPVDLDQDHTAVIDELTQIGQELGCPMQDLQLVGVEFTNTDTGEVISLDREGIRQLTWYLPGMTVENMVPGMTTLMAMLDKNDGITVAVPLP